VIPSPLLIRLVVLVLLAGIAGSIFPALAPLWPALGAVVLLATTLDAALGWRPPAIEARRALPGSLPLGVWHDIALRIGNPGRRALELRIYDHHPAAFQSRGLPQVLRVPASAWGELRYAVRPVARGEHRFGRVELRVASLLGLWEFRRYAGEPAATRVYPNFAALTKYALFATDNRLSQIGILQRRRRGEGLEFHQLREYREGDSLRSIDWKATARSTRLISRDYQDERDQQVVLVIDCGRRMAAQDGELAHFDHVLNAALLLAYVGLRQGDAVGFMTMSGVERFVAPRKSAATVNVILNSLYDLQPTLATTDYYAAALALGARLKKRALVVILSNLRDEDDDTLAPALQLLRARHLVLFASLREAVITGALKTRVDSFERALTHAAAADYLHERALAFRRIERRGALALDVEPQHLPVALVNRYLDIKRSGRL
jgi:uncharacterized protein (DUF58 family)